ncbi:MAG: hypothetical protein J6S91_09235, partial [Treponema sp.]|nr:hypothetical protein [Treponema sp.]
MTSRKSIFILIFSLCIFQLSARDRDDEYFASIIQQQEAEIKKLDERNSAEEEKRRQKRSSQENKRIDAETDEFYQNASKSK